VFIYLQPRTYTHVGILDVGYKCILDACVTHASIICVRLSVSVELVYMHHALLYVYAHPLMRTFSYVYITYVWAPLYAEMYVRICVHACVHLCSPMQAVHIFARIQMHTQSMAVLVAHTPTNIQGRGERFMTSLCSSIHMRLHRCMGIRVYVYKGVCICTLRL
jgi:hypothetical protein